MWESFSQIPWVKKGTKVRCIDSLMSFYTVGEVYTVHKMYNTLLIITKSGYGNGAGAEWVSAEEFSLEAVEKIL